MPEHIVSFLTGSMPEPLLVIPDETWATFELTGAEGEFIATEFLRAWAFPPRRLLYEIGEMLHCKTVLYRTRRGGPGHAITVPRQVVQSHGIRLSHHIEAVLIEIVRQGESLPIYPRRMVEDQIPNWFRTEERSP